MWLNKHLFLRAVALSTALLWGAMEAVALQKARVTRWRLSHREF